MTKFLSLLLGLAPFLSTSPDPPSEAQTPRIRVLLGENRHQGNLAASSCLHLVLPPENSSYSILRPFQATQVNCRKGRIGIGNARLPAGEILLVPESSGSVQWEGKAYHGSLLLRPISRDQFHVINIVDLEDYVTGVLPSEMGSRAPLEALKAQAVCARTYAYMQKKERRSSGFDTYADVRDQVYGGIPANPLFSKATRATRGQFLLFRSKQFKTYFHSTCGGQTESVFDWRGDKEIPPLAGSPCGFCTKARWFRWNTHVSRKTIQKSLSQFIGNQNIHRIQIRKRNNNNRIKEVSVQTENSREHIVPGPRFRTLLGANIIRSTRWTITQTPTGWSFLGNGWGHGVGLCQEGAMQMARQGHKFRNILSRYYPETDLHTIYR